MADQITEVTASQPQKIDLKKPGDYLDALNKRSGDRYLKEAGKLKQPTPEALKELSGVSGSMSGILKDLAIQPEKIKADPHLEARAATALADLFADMKGADPAMARAIFMEAGNKLWGNPNTDLEVVTRDMPGGGTGTRLPLSIEALLGPAKGKLSMAANRDKSLTAAEIDSALAPLDFALRHNATAFTKDYMQGRNLQPKVEEGMVDLMKTIYDLESYKDTLAPVPQTEDSSTVSKPIDNATVSAKLNEAKSSGQSPHQILETIAGENKGELEQRAQELAKEVRAKGAGFINGYFNGDAINNYGDPRGLNRGYISLGGFKEGQIMNADTLSRGDVRVYRDWDPNYVDRYNDRDKQLLVIDHDGKKTQFRYSMPTDAGDQDIERRGTTATFVMNVPDELAQKLASQISADPKFMDSLFRNIYPGLVGSDPNKDMTRLKANALVFVDQRTYTRNPATGKSEAKKEIMPYSQPIPY